MDDIKVNNLVTLDNNKSYVILDQVNVDNSIYCFITELIDNDSFMIIKKETDNDNILFKLLNDDVLENKLKSIFASRLGIEI